MTIKLSSIPKNCHRFLKIVIEIDLIIGVRRTGGTAYGVREGRRTAYGREGVRRTGGRAYGVREGRRTAYGREGVRRTGGKAYGVREDDTR